MRILRTLQHELEGVIQDEDEEEKGSSDEDNLDEVESGTPLLSRSAAKIVGDKAGFLLKKGKSTSTHRRRWFVLHDKLLYYFESPTVFSEHSLCFLV